jgi:18S rRNA (guanine1575-N7)-methyltransferase
VSALQWLCYSDKKDHKSTRRLNSFFTSLYRCLRRGARAALQIYPETAEQLDLISQTAAACGFGGGLVVDFPNSTKAKKYFLCLFAGVDPSKAAMPKALGTAGSGASVMGVDNDDDVVRVYSRKAAAAGAGAGSATNVAFEEAAASATFEKRRARPKKRGSKVQRTSVKSKSWIQAKKTLQRARGDETRRDSKYTGRKRSGFRV